MSGGRPISIGGLSNITLALAQNRREVGTGFFFTPNDTMREAQQ